MRDDKALMLDMLIAAQKIQRFVSGLSEDDFKSNEMAQSATIREFQVIGEAARMISDETKNQHSAIAWKMIAGMRNRLIHEYFAIRLNLVWQAIQDDLTPLINELEKILQDEEGKEE